jgi:hypothetical protein
VDVVGCVTDEDQSQAPCNEGPIGIKLANPGRLRFVPYKGHLGLFHVPRALVYPQLSCWR